MEQARLAGIRHIRVIAAIVLGAISAAASVALVVTDGLDAGAGWSHHAGVSAAPLLIIAGAIAVATLAHPHTAASVVKAVVGVLAFASWGLAQLVPSSPATGWLGDVAILLFVFDAGYIIVTDARSFPGSERELRLGVGPVQTGRERPASSRRALGQSATGQSGGSTGLLRARR
jgi:hypothetical protein